MEIIQLPGYVDSEKLEIAQRYLIPKASEKNGHQEGHGQVHPRRPHLHIAEVLCPRGRGTQLREIPGQDPPEDSQGLIVLERQGPARSSTVDKPAVEKYLGKPCFREDDDQARHPAGHVGGPGLDQHGRRHPDHRGGRQSRQGRLQAHRADGLGDAGIGRHRVHPGPPPGRGCGTASAADYFEERQIHLHIPEGATPKDGPSRGHHHGHGPAVPGPRQEDQGPARHDRRAVADGAGPSDRRPQGEDGRRRRNKIRDIIIPKANEKDLDEIPEHVKKGITFHPVESMEEVIAIVLPS